MSYELLFSVHIVSVILLLGAGGGSAFYKFMSDRSGNLEVIVHTNRMVVLADWLFTTPSVILQPLTGYLLMCFMHIPFETLWLKTAIILYVISIVLWFFAVWLQIKMEQMATMAHKNGDSLPPIYKIYVKWWMISGVFSFAAMAWIFVLMVWK